MKIRNTVKTTERALEIIKNKMGENFSHWNLENKSCQCECGETPMLLYNDYDKSQILKVGICESCGDDDAFIDEVLN